MNDLKPLAEIYGKRFFARRFKLSWRAPYVCDAVRIVFDPSSVVDVGCAIGDLVLQFNKMGIKSDGFEGSLCATPYIECQAENFFVVDLRIPFYKQLKVKRYDVALCLEVAEHIEPECAEIFAENLSTLSQRLVLSMAPPGQKGHYHVNCQPLEYWEKIFSNLGYGLNVEKTVRMKKLLEPWRKCSGIKAYWHNLTVFEWI